MHTCLLPLACYLSMVDSIQKMQRLRLATEERGVSEWEGTVEYHDLSHPHGTILRPSLSSEVGQLKDLATLLVAAH